jgi:hypothetical protein
MLAFPNCSCEAEDFPSGDATLEIAFLGLLLSTLDFSVAALRRTSAAVGLSRRCRASV